MKIFLTPYDLATRNCAARGAFLLGFDVISAFPPTNLITEIAKSAPARTADAFAWLYDLLHDGTSFPGEDSSHLWDESLRVREQLSNADNFAGLCPALPADDAPGPRSIHVLKDILNNGRDGWSRLAADITAERAAESTGSLLGRTRSQSRSALIEQSLEHQLCRFSLCVPQESHAAQLYELTDHLHAEQDEVFASLAGIIDLWRTGSPPPAQAQDALKQASAALNHETAQLVSERTMSTEMLTVTLAQYPTDFTRKSALASFDRKQPPSADNNTTDSPDTKGALALIFKPSRIRA